MVKNKNDLTKKSRSELILTRVLLIILALMLMLMGLYFIVLLPVAALCFYFAHVYKKELKRRKTQKPEPEAVKEEQKESPYMFLSFKVAGVTFNNGRKTRQAILRAFKWGDEEVQTISFEPYIYEGKPAVYVKINDQIIGNVPSDYIEKFSEMEQLHKRDHISYEIYGGNKLEDGTRTNYGCQLHIRYLKGEA